MSPPGATLVAAEDSAGEAMAAFERAGIIGAE